MKLTPWIFISGAVLCFLAVSIGAFGAHALESLLVENNRLATFETASHYHFFHALVLLILGLINMPKALLPTQQFVAICFILGVCIFSGSLYSLSVTNIGILGAITPIGGVIFLLAWIGMVKIGLQWKNWQESSNH